jgi:hypothetical protein
MLQKPFSPSRMIECKTKEGTLNMNDDTVYENFKFTCPCCQAHNDIHVGVTLDAKTPAPQLPGDNDVMMCDRCRCWCIVTGPNEVRVLSEQDREMLGALFPEILALIQSREVQKQKQATHKDLLNWNHSTNNLRN